MSFVVIISLAVLAAAAAFFLLRRRAAVPSGWSAGPIINGASLSAGVNVGADGSFDFPTAAPGVHYVTKAAGPIDPAAVIRLSYRIDAEPDVAFIPVTDPRPDSPTIGPTLYFQRAGDDWSGAGEFEAYRWWAEFAAPTPIAPGEHEIVAPLGSRWMAVQTSNSDDNIEAFRAALAQAERVGFTFGGGQDAHAGYGHGVYATGNARFTLIALEIAPAPIAQPQANG